MRAPEFWQSRGVLSAALAPAGWLHAMVARRRRSWARPEPAPVPVLCVGNLVVGGAGKTPVALALAERLRAAGTDVHLLGRGYGGRLAGPVRVEPGHHAWTEVGDEALLLAGAAPSWIARDRLAGARAAAAAGAQAIVMDDGLQNTRLAPDLSLVVIDGGYGFGNGRVMPAGPLREALSDGLLRPEAAVLVGADRHGLAERLAATLPVIRAALAPLDPPAAWQGRRLLAFAGIGRPEKLFATLRGLGAELVACHGFADHHGYGEGEVAALLARAHRAGAAAVTTAKDWVRLPARFQARVEVLRVALRWTGPQDEAAVDRLLARLGRAR